MQIVIDIDEDIYNRFTHNEVKPRCEITEKERFQMGADAICLTRAFCNGTPLPKGHGRLIAEPTEEDIAKTVGGQNDFAECIRDAVRMVFINAPTIIEADKEM